MFDNSVKVPIYKNSKTPAAKGWNKPEYNNQFIDHETNNIGLITGEKNNLIVLDIDLKDEGLKEFNLYINQYGEPKTLKQQTPSGGFHYFFKYDHPDKQCKFLIQNYIINRSKYRSKGLDIRSNGGYILIEPSKINNKEYKFINNEPVDYMPLNLIHFLLMGVCLSNNGASNKKMIKSQIDNNILHHDNNYIYDVSSEKVKEYLNKLDDKYLNIFNDWLIILTICKNLNMYDIFDEWSKKSPKYDSANNAKIWNKNKGLIDVNYLIRILNDSGSKYNYIERYKKIEHITNDIKIKTVNFNNMHINDNYFTFDHFKNYDTHIIKSTTGTGKTTQTAKHIKSYIDQSKNKNLKIMTISPRKTLCEQHIKSFNDVNIELKSYQDNDNLLNNNITICINSLNKLSSASKEHFNDYIIYIDEITSFLQTLTHNETLDKDIKQIYYLLMKIIKNAYKVIVSDAIINDNTFNFLKYRSDDKKIYIINEYKKY
jgi:hypothetical protein